MAAASPRRGRVDDQSERLRREVGIAEHGRDGEPVHARPRGQPGLHVLDERRVALALGGRAAQAPKEPRAHGGHRQAYQREIDRNIANRECPMKRTTMKAPTAGPQRRPAPRAASATSAA